MNLVPTGYIKEALKDNLNKTLRGTLKEEVFI